MDITANRATRIVAVSLIAIVVLQIVYMAFLGGPKPLEAGTPLSNADVLRYFDERGAEITTVWTLEAMAFLAIALGSLVIALRGASNTTAWAALSLFGVFNMIQIGMGLAMFEPAARAGGDDMGLFGTFVSGAFFFYFVAKVMLGVAALIFGLRLLGAATGGIKALAGLTALVGAAAIGLNVAGMALGMSVLMYAGAAGTAAALFTALTAGKATRSN